MTERRKYRRFNINVQGGLIAEGTSDWVKILEISIDGLRILAPKSIKPGERVSIHLDLVTEYAFYGTVKWAMYTTENGKNLYEIGIESDKIVHGGEPAASPEEKGDLVLEILETLKHPDAPRSMAGLL